MPCGAQSTYTMSRRRRSTTPAGKWFATVVMLAIALIVGLVVYGILSAVFGMTQGLRGGVR